MADRNISRERRNTSENPPLNTDVNPLRASGGMAPEIIPVQPLSFGPANSSVKTVNYNSDYSDAIDTHDEIAEAQSQIKSMNNHAVVNAENLAAERQKALEL